MKLNSYPVLAAWLTRQYAAELKKLDRDAVPADLRELLPPDRSHEYCEGLVTGGAHAPRIARLIELVAPKDGGTRWQPLELRYSDRRVVIGGETRRLAPADFAFYAVVVRRRVNAREFVKWDTEGLAEEYLREYRRVTHCLDGNRERVVCSFRNGVERQWFEERKCKVNRAIRSFGEWPGCDYKIVSKGTRPNTYSGVIVDQSCIRIRDGPSVDLLGAVAGACPDYRRASRPTSALPPVSPPAGRCPASGAPLSVAALADVDSAWSISCRALSQSTPSFAYR